MNILVTGGCGFIGSNFIKHMLKKYPDYEITNIDKLTYAGNLDTLKNVIFVPELNKFIQVKVSTSALKTIDKYGLLPYLKKQGLSLSDIK